MVLFCSCYVFIVSLISFASYIHAKYMHDVHLSHLNKDYLLTHLLTYIMSWLVFTLTRWASCTAMRICGSCGSWWRSVIQRCCRTCCREMRRRGSTSNMRATSSFASDETESQFTPVKLTLPSPIRARMSDGVSDGPFANGVCLQSITETSLASFAIQQQQ